MNNPFGSNFMERSQKKKHGLQKRDLKKHGTIKTMMGIDHRKCGGAMKTMMMMMKMDPKKYGKIMKIMMGMNQRKNIKNM